MLAITSSTAYEVCVNKKDGVCVDSSACTGTNFILDIDGNKCANLCDNEKIIFVIENICINSCDKSVYTQNTNLCGLCYQINPQIPYKLIKTQDCLSDIPIGAEFYNEKLKLLKCKSGYKLEDETCITNCYETCATFF